ncbi:MAG TPA: S-layer homology domain-containing protein, partial [Chloroflexia bacterium]
TFTGYSEDLPAPGSTVCQSGKYYRKHSPWVNFTNIPTTTNQPLTSWPADLADLPTVSFVIPNQDNDMHDGTVAAADAWLQAHLDPYVQWAQAHNSLFILTWDEDDFTVANHIPTIFVGPMVLTGQYGEPVNHFNVLRTLEDMYGLPYAGQSGTAQPITDVWQTTTPSPTSTPAASHTPSPTATETVQATSTATASASATASATASASASAFVSASATVTVTPTATATATATVTATSTACNMVFTDVGEASPFYSYIRCLACKGIVGGYSDGTFRPHNNVTRGQASKMLANSAGFDEPVSGQTFSDVPPGSPFYTYIERLAGRGHISGYGDGTFQPGSWITRGQLAKIASNAAGFTDTIPPGTRTFEDVPNTDPFWVFIERLSKRNIVGGYPCGREGEPCPGVYFRPWYNVTRGQAAKIVANTFFPNCAIP